MWKEAAKVTSELCATSKQEPWSSTPFLKVVVRKLKTRPSDKSDGRSLMLSIRMHATIKGKAFLDQNNRFFKDSMDTSCNTCTVLQRSTMPERSSLFNSGTMLHAKVEDLRMNIDFRKTQENSQEPRHFFYC